MSRRSSLSRIISTSLDSIIGIAISWLVWERHTSHTFAPPEPTNSDGSSLSLRWSALSAVADTVILMIISRLMTFIAASSFSTCTIFDWPAGPCHNILISFIRPRPASPPLWRWVAAAHGHALPPLPPEGWSVLSKSLVFADFRRRRAARFQRARGWRHMAKILYAGIGLKLDSLAFHYWRFDTLYFTGLCYIWDYWAAADGEVCRCYSAAVTDYWLRRAFAILSALRLSIAAR